MALVGKLGVRNLRSDRFGTLCAIVGVALGTATVNVVLVIDTNTRYAESRTWTTNPDMAVDLERTVRLAGFFEDGRPATALDAKSETHEDYQVMRSAIRLGSLSAFLVGALIVFFTFGVVVERRKRELALLRSLGALPGQVARIFFLEALLVGLSGAVFGFLLSFPLSYVTAFAGITTTGRSRLYWLYFPWKQMIAVSLIGASCALLGVLRPALEVARLPVSETLRPRFLEEGRSLVRKRTSSLTLITLPFMMLLYILIRPFFREILPSLAFFVVEAGLVCAAFLAMLVLVPELVRAIGAGVARLLPRGPAAARLLTLRRVERMGHEMAWAVVGVMLVFALLLSLHIITMSLKREVESWATRAVRPYTFVYTRGRQSLPELPAVPPQVVQARFSGRSPWPNALYAAVSPDLVELARTTDRPELVELASKLGPGKIILSRMMSRRYGIGVRDYLEVEGKTRKARLQVVAVTDEIGYVPMVGPYRNSKTYGIVDSADFDLISPYTSPLGASLAFRDPTGATSFEALFGGLRREYRGRIRVEIGEDFEKERIAETDKDFAIFDVILALTTFLAAVGIANNMVLSAHGRRREIALYRVLGMTTDQVRQMFVMEGALVGVLGGALAVLLGVPLGVAGIGALQVISAFEVHFELPPTYPLFTLLGAVVVSLIAAQYPASRAARSDSAESIHYE